MRTNWGPRILATVLLWAGFAALAPVQNSESFITEGQMLDQEKMELIQKHADLAARSEAVSQGALALNEKYAAIEKMPPGIGKDAVLDGYRRERDAWSDKNDALVAEKAQYNDARTSLMQRTSEYQRRVKVAAAANKFQAGDHVQVLWEGKYWNARVVNAESGSYYITYDGYGAEWNEWVDDTRIRK